MDTEWQQFLNRLENDYDEEAVFYTWEFFYNCFLVYHDVRKATTIPHYDELNKQLQRLFPGLQWYPLQCGYGDECGYENDIDNEHDHTHYMFVTKQILTSDELKTIHSDGYQFGVLLGYPCADEWDECCKRGNLMNSQRFSIECYVASNKHDEPISIMGNLAVSFAKLSAFTDFAKKAESVMRTSELTRLMDVHTEIQVFSFDNVDGCIVRKRIS